MAKTRGSVKKATKSAGEHVPSATTVCESESPRPQRGILPRAGEEILENKGPINEASIERMTRGKDTPILMEVETSKIRKGKAKVDSANIDNMERTGVRPVEVAEVTSKQQCNSLAIVFYIGPLEVASPTKEAADDAGQS
ncbi:hypothetical protein PVK06_023796 [Gossypium arboreum]|uniref:Uncharacterized protein n=1 Tax=Gossypium arboreum TaxID=29729 RepID=A0ABR0PC62_GOSAR|nr:hypothetical protein PVK06_023796 [Gossypium arboreum]